MMSAVAEEALRERGTGRGTFEGCGCDMESDVVRDVSGHGKQRALESGSGGKAANLCN